MSINIITPCTRKELLAQSMTRITQDQWDLVANWFVVYDKDREDTFSPIRTQLSECVRHKIIELDFRGPGISGNPQRNYALDILDRRSDRSGFVYFLDDDTVIQNKLWDFFGELVRGLPCKIYTWDMFNASRNIVLRGDNPVVNNIDTSMYIVPLAIACTLRWKIDEYNADGIYIEQLVRQYPGAWEYVKKHGVMSVYNALTTTCCTAPATVARRLSVAVVMSGRSACFREVFLNQLVDMFGAHDVSVFMSLNEEQCEGNSFKGIDVVKGVAYGPLVTDDTVKGYEACTRHPETNIRNTYSMFLHNKLAFELIPNPEQFDVIIKFRPDIVSNQQLPLACSTLWGDDAKTTLCIPVGNDWRGGVNDMVAFGTCDAMRNYCAVIDALDDYVKKDGVVFHPETLLLHHLTKCGATIKRIEWGYTMNTMRHTKYQFSALEESGQWDKIVEYFSEHDAETIGDKFLMARSLFEVGEVEASIAAYSEIAETWKLTGDQQKTASHADDRRTVLIHRIYANTIAGHPTTVIKLCIELLQEFHNDLQAVMFYAVAQMDLGNYVEAHAMISCLTDDIRKVDVNIWYTLQISRALASRGHDPNFDIDGMFSQTFKVAHSEQSEPTLWSKIRVGHAFVTDEMMTASINRVERPIDNADELRRAADEIGNMFVLDCKGFHRNNRICRSMGFAIMEAVHSLKSGTLSMRTDSWQTIMDVIVKWRRVASHNSGVWWLGKGEYIEDCAMRTPLYLDKRPVYRYTPYIRRIINAITSKVVQVPELATYHQAIKNLPPDCSPKQVNDVFNGNDLAMHQELGESKIPGVVICVSPTKDKKGTTIAVSSLHTKQRAEQYDSILQRLAHAIDQKDQNAIFLFVYYWFNYQRLTRGTAICGLAFVAVCLHVYATQSLPAIMAPSGVQWDWEAFLELDDNRFSTRMRSYFAEVCDRALPLHAVTPMSAVEMCKLLGE